jgi:hypothetical protein
VSTIETHRSLVSDHPDFIRRWREDNAVLTRAGQLEDDETPEASDLLAAAERVKARRLQEYHQARDAGVTPCPASWSRTIPCLHPDGDQHPGSCFGADEGSWSRATSYFTPEAGEQISRSTWPTTAIPTPTTEDLMTATTTGNHLTITAIRWRMLNKLGEAAAVPMRAMELLDSQDGTTEDLRWLGENDLVVATIIGRITRLDLVEHLDHHGSAMVLGLRLNARGRRTLGAWQNRVLLNLSTAGRRMPMRTLLAQASADVSNIQNLCRRRLLTVATRSTGETIAADDIALLPAATLVVKLTDKGRTYLPL